MKNIKPSVNRKITNYSLLSLIDKGYFCDGKVKFGTQETTNF